MLIAVLAACACVPASATAASKAPPKPVPLTSGWEIRDLVNTPPPPQPPPPNETEEGTEDGQPAPAPEPVEAYNPNWRPVTVPGVFSADANPSLFGGTAKQYRLRFTAPATRKYSWVVHFEQARRRTTAFLNGKRIGVSIDPYTPFELPAKGLKPGKVNELVVTVDSRKDPRLPEAWWNWGGITRPVTLMPRGRATIHNLALLSDVTCKGLARNCKAALKLDGVLDKLPKEKQRFTTKVQVVGNGKRRRRVRTRVKAPLPQPKLTVKLRSPTGRVTRKTLALKGLRGGRRRLNELPEIRVPGPKLWSPDKPQLYSASATLTYKGRQEQVVREKLGLRSVKVVHGELRLNNRPINLHGASMHSDMPGHGAALTSADMDTMVRELKEAGANITREHYVFNEALLERFDKAGIMVWNQPPVWQRDHGANLLQYATERKRAMAQLERTVEAARNHPSVITHSVANELSFTPDRKAGTRRYILDATAKARDLDPTLPISLDIKGRPGYEEQFVYENLDMIGINQYFGWYPWVEDFNTLEPYLREMHDLYPNHALVMTEFGAEGRADMNDFPPETLGTYAFQANQVARTIDLVNRLPFMAGEIHWTLREFEINPGWLGGVRIGRPGRNTRHYKGVLTYNGEKKPAWYAMRDRYVRTPLYRR